MGKDSGNIVAPTHPAMLFLLIIFASFFFVFILNFPGEASITKEEKTLCKKIATRMSDSSFATRLYLCDFGVDRCYLSSRGSVSCIKNE